MMSGIFGSDDPYALFINWLDSAIASEPNDPGAMSLATVDAAGRPSVRIVLFRELVDGAFHFFTNYQSRKAKELEHNPNAALCFHWKSLLRQIRIEGVVEKTAPEISDRYFHGRHPDSQLGAWASLQSEELPNRAVLQDRFDRYRAEFSNGPTPRPPHWGGYRLIPARIEFWQDRPHRLHDRELFEKTPNGWTLRNLYP
jgi:pyridoxamine 5'-phosphate oxidase